MRFVRHQTNLFDVYDAYRTDLSFFEAYQSTQGKEVFKGTRYIMSFAGAQGTKAIFLGIYEVVTCYKRNDVPAWLRDKVKINTLPESNKGLLSNEVKETNLLNGINESNLIYDLKETNLLSDFRERLIIEWGRGTLSWSQKKDKEIVSLRQKGEIEPFKSYSEILLSHLKLVDIINNHGANVTWVTALSAVNGVYAIIDIIDGKIYIGSAYGKEGIWGRWKQKTKRIKLPKFSVYHFGNSSRYSIKRRLYCC